MSVLAVVLDGSIYSAVIVLPSCHSAAPKPEGSAGRLIGNPLLSKPQMADAMRPQAWGVLAVLIVLWKLRKVQAMCVYLLILKGCRDWQENAGELWSCDYRWSDRSLSTLVRTLFVRTLNYRLIISVFITTSLLHHFHHFSGELCSAQLLQCQRLKETRQI